MLVLLFFVGLFHVLKYVLIVPFIQRWVERLIDLIFIKVIMQTFALMRWQELFHKEDAEFDFVKSKTNKLFVDYAKHISPTS